MERRDAVAAAVALGLLVALLGSSCGTERASRRGRVATGTSAARFDAGSIVSVEFPIHSGQWVLLGYAAAVNRGSRPIHIQGVTVISASGALQRLRGRLLLVRRGRHPRLLPGGADGWPPAGYGWVARLPRSVDVPAGRTVDFGVAVRPMGRVGATVTTFGFLVDFTARGVDYRWRLPAPATMHIVARAAPES